jgi:Tetratricopeptide repeat
MEPSQIDALVHKLVANPHDAEALTTAHKSGESDPKSYALFLERVGAQTTDPVYASHWLSEAANVWSTTLGDAHRAARVLMQAIDRDPTQPTAADRLAQLYREKGDNKALVALLERRAKTLSPLAAQNGEVRATLTAMHEELGRLWGESLRQPKKALDNFCRAIELSPASVYAIYGAREIYKSLGRWGEALSMYDAELSLEQDPARRTALLRDEAATRRLAGDLAGATRALARARQIDTHDPALQQEYGATVIERIAAGEDVPVQERSLGVELLVGLAEIYDGEHGLAYSAGALEIDPGHDRALQLYAYYARALQREDDIASRYLAYVQANPNGAMVPDARWLLVGLYEAAGRFDDAIQVLEPLQGHADAKAKLTQLQASLGQRLPSTAPPPPLPPPSTPPRTSPLSSSGPALPDPAALVDSPTASVEWPPMTSITKDDSSKFAGLLAQDPANAEAVSWTLEDLRVKRDYDGMRNCLLAAVRASPSADNRKEWLREIAALCEGKLGDSEGAIDAWRQLVAMNDGGEDAQKALVRLLDATQRWDDLAALLAQQTTTETDLEKKIALEKKLAALHEQRRNDFAAAATSWERIATLTPDDDGAVANASALFEKGGALEDAARVIVASLSAIADPKGRDALLERLGQLRERLHDPAGAAESYAETAAREDSPRLWEAAERCFAAAGKWERAAAAAVKSAELDADVDRKAKHFARAAEFFARAGDDAAVGTNLELATELAPTNDDFAKLLTDHYAAAARWNDLAVSLTKRGDRLPNPQARIDVRRQAARLYEAEIGDKDLARETWRRVLEDGDDQEALERLVEHAIGLADYSDATASLRRLEPLASDILQKVRVALREADLVADGLGDVETAIARYERLLAELDPNCRPALQAIADLQEARDNPAAAADALKRELSLVASPLERAPIAARLARLYEQLDDPKSAIAALEIVRAEDAEDFDALARLCDLCEKTEQWSKVADLIAQRIEVEADDEELSVLTRKLAQVLADKLDRGDEALAVLDEVAGRGDASARAAYVELGDRLGWRGIVATKLVEWWFAAKPGPERVANLRGAFERFADVGRDEDAVQVACEIARSKGADLELAQKLEQFAVKMGNLDGLGVAHEVMAAQMTGLERAQELVRQAELQLKAGAARSEALRHGEEGLASAPIDSVEPLLERLAAIAQGPTEVVDLYERQIARHRTLPDRLNALARAAQVAAEHEEIDRARALFDLALSAAPTDEAVVMLERAAREADARSGGQQLRRALCLAMANGGQGARDGGRTRGALVRRAALIAYTDLNDPPQAIALLGDALIAHVDPTTLDALEELTRDLGDLRQAEATLTRALAEVFEGPLVRQLLARRAKLRRLQLDDKAGAAADLRKLYELSPSDQTVLDELSALLTDLNDHRAMVQVYEDQILRGKDVGSRIELARQVAQLWERELNDPREAADAWRRVLRMKQGDPEATAGLERAKANMLHRASDAPPEPDVPPVAPPASPTPEAAAASLSLAGESISDTQVSAAPLIMTDDVRTATDGDEDGADIPSVDAAAGDAVVVADDLAESVDDDADDDPTTENSREATPRSKRSVPPPLPRT